MHGLDCTKDKCVCRKSIECRHHSASPEGSLDVNKSLNKSVEEVVNRLAKGHSPCRKCCSTIH